MLPLKPLESLDCGCVPCARRGAELPQQHTLVVGWGEARAACGAWCIDGWHTGVEMSLLSSSASVKGTVPRCDDHMPRTPKTSISSLPFVLIDAKSIVCQKPSRVLFLSRVVLATRVSSASARTLPCRYHPSQTSATLGAEGARAGPATTMAQLLEKLEAAELRIGLCEDTKLAKLLEIALPNILGFLSSAEPAVRNKVMAILGHINKRVKGDASVLLPLGGLAKLFLSTDHPMVSNFALVYVEMAFARVPAAERAALLPKLLVGMAARQVAQQDTLLQLLLLALPTLALPKVAAELKGPEASLPFLEAAADRSLALRHLLDVLLYLPPCTRGQAEGAPPPAPPGLSHAAAKRVCGKLGPEEVRGELLHLLLTTYHLLSTIEDLLTTRCAASCSPPRSSPCCGCSAARSAPARSSRRRRCCPTGSSRAAMPTARWRSMETSSSSGCRRRRCAWA